MLTTQLSSHPHYFPHYSSSNDTTAIYLDALIVDFFRSLDLSRRLLKATCSLLFLIYLISTIVVTTVISKSTGPDFHDW